MNTKFTLTLIFIALALQNCSSMPPVLDTSIDIQHQSADSTSLRVRSLKDEDIESLGKFADLWRLDFGSGWGIEEAPITDQGLISLSQLPLTKLDSLDLGYCQGISDKGIAALGEKDWKSLKLLMLMNSKNITDQSLLHIANMHSLIELSLAGNPNITGETLSLLAQLPNFDYLDLRGCTQLSPKGLKEIQKLSKLKFLMVGGCTTVSDTDLLTLQSALPNCYISKNDNSWSQRIK